MSVAAAGPARGRARRLAARRSSGRCSRCGCSPTRGDRHARRPLDTTATRRRRTTTASASATTRSSSSSAATAARARADLRPAAPARPRGLHLGQRCRRRRRRRAARDGPCAALAAHQAGARSSTGPATFLNEAVGQLADAVHRAGPRRHSRPSPGRRRGGRKVAREPGLGRAEARQARRAGRRARQPEFTARHAAAARVALRPQRAPAARRPGRSSPSSSSTPPSPPARPSARFAYLFPTRGSGTGRLRSSRCG